MLFMEFITSVLSRRLKLLQIGRDKCDRPTRTKRICLFQEGFGRHMC